MSAASSASRDSKPDRAGIINVHCGRFVRMRFSPSTSIAVPCSRKRRAADLNASTLRQTLKAFHLISGFCHLASARRCISIIGFSRPAPECSPDVSFSHCILLFLCCWSQLKVNRTGNEGLCPSGEFSFFPCECFLALSYNFICLGSTRIPKPCPSKFRDQV